MKGKELGRRVQVEELVSDKSGDLAYLCRREARLCDSRCREVIGINNGNMQ